MLFPCLFIRGSPTFQAFTGVISNIFVMFSGSSVGCVIHRDIEYRNGEAIFSFRQANAQAKLRGLTVSRMAAVSFSLLLGSHISIVRVAWVINM
jgi:hypothetical protein